MDALSATMKEAGACARVMEESAHFIRRGLGRPDAARLGPWAEDVCADLWARHDDLLGALAELRELRACGAPERVLEDCAEHLLQWLREPLAEARELARALEAASRQDPAAACVPVVESAVGVLRAFERVKSGAWNGSSASTRSTSS
jgi:hypothetical protein